MFVDFHEVNTPIMAVSTWSHWKQSWEEMGTFGTGELGRVGTNCISTPLHLGPHVVWLQLVALFPSHSSVYSDLLALYSQYSLFTFTCSNLGAFVPVCSGLPIDNCMYYSLTVFSFLRKCLFWAIAYDSNPTSTPRDFLISISYFSP